MSDDMCGRYTLIRLADFLEEYDWIQACGSLPGPRYNIAPSQEIVVVENRSPARLTRHRWGLVPSWAKDLSVGSRMINARAETLDQKPAFRAALRRRRCIIPADGFFEWRKDPGGVKTPILLRRKAGRPFAFAGLWDEWRAHDGSSIRTSAIITTTPNALAAKVHDRMPVILDEPAMRAWLDPDEAEAQSVLPLLVACPAEGMELVAVSRAVNNPRIDGPECVARASGSSNLFSPEV
jgi:putative SOS response-associated peptidase YedK